MGLIVGFGIALVALARNVLRSVLAIVGLVIGVAAVLTMVALGRGARESVTEDMESAGTNRVFVRAGNYTRGGDAVGITSGLGKATTLTAGDADALRRFDDVAAATEEVDDRAAVAYEDETVFIPILGCGSDFPTVYDASIEQGRFLDRSEVDGAESVAVITRAVRDELFGPGTDPTGREILIAKQSFTVVGVGGGDEEKAFVPFTTLQQMLGIDYLNGITASTERAGDASELAARVRALLRERHKLDDPERLAAMPKATGEFAMEGTGEVPDDFTVRTQAARALTQGLYTTAAAFVLASMPRLDEVSSEEMVNTLTQANSTMTLLLAGIAAVSLVVGGIGIMNIMLLAVTERTKEVGLRLSVGARRRDVLLQFLLEAALLGLLGGVLGIGLGYASAAILTGFLGWPTQITAQAVALAFSLAFVVAVSFGYYPAFRASRLDPIDALRYE